MGDSFFSSTENFYKYLITVGVLMIILTVYYPLKEKQELETLNIRLKNELKILSHKIEENEGKILNLKKKPSRIKNDLILIKEIQTKNEINEISLEGKYDELKSRKSYITVFSCLSWFFLPLGLFLIVFGFVKWYKEKKIDDQILLLEKRKLEKEVENLENGIT